MANLALNVTASLAIALLYTTLQLQAQGVREAVGGHSNAAEYVLLEPRPEQLVSTILTGMAVTAADTTKPMCGNCKCCLKVKPDVCLTTCCFVKTCNGPSCTSQMVSCGCNTCDW